MSFLGISRTAWYLLTGFSFTNEIFGTRGPIIYTNVATLRTDAD